MSNRDIRLIIDCDPGHDDALALILAQRHAQVLGITTVSGNAPLDAVTVNALAVTELLGATTPVYRGADGPLLPAEDGKLRHAPLVHGASGLAGSRLPRPQLEVESLGAVDFLLNAANRHPGVWLAAIGPLTNVALAIQRDPDFAERLSGISIMGGSTRGGNVTATAEFNIWADPEAADVVFRSGARIRLCGLNLTHQLKTTDELLGRLKSGDSPRMHFAADLIEYLHGRMAALTGERRAALHDPCAVFAVTHPELFEFQHRHVAVELAGTLTRGMTVVDERMSARSQAADVQVAYRIDHDRAMQLLLESLDETLD